MADSRPRIVVVSNNLAALKKHLCEIVNELGGDCEYDPVSLIVREPNNVYWGMLAEDKNDVRKACGLTIQGFQFADDCQFSGEYLNYAVPYLMGLIRWVEDDHG